MLLQSPNDLIFAVSALLSWQYLIGRDRGRVFMGSFLTILGVDSKGGPD